MIIGYSTRHSLVLDIDNTTISKAISLTRLLQQEYNKLGNALILISSIKPLQTKTRYSKNNRPYLIKYGCSFHIVFDNIIGYNNVVYIQTVLEGLNVINKGHSSIRKRYGDTTLRISPQYGKFISKPIPKPIKYIKSPHINKSDGCIEKYLNQLSMVYRLFYPSNQITSLSPSHQILR